MRCCSCKERLQAGADVYIRNQATVACMVEGTTCRDERIRKDKQTDLAAKSLWRKGRWQLVRIEVHDCAIAKVTTAFKEGIAIPVINIEAPKTLDLNRIKHLAEENGLVMELSSGYAVESSKPKSPPEPKNIPEVDKKSAAAGEKPDPPTTPEGTGRAKAKQKLADAKAKKAKTAKK